MKICWIYGDPLYHYWDDGELCGATIQSVGVLENLLRGLLTLCPKCRDLHRGQGELSL